MLPHFLCSVVKDGQTDEFAACAYEEGAYAPKEVFAAVLAGAEQVFVVGIDHGIDRDAVGEHAGDIVERPHDLRERHGERDSSSDFLFVAQDGGFEDAV